jgi:preprotein translocase subunit SecD
MRFRPVLTTGSPLPLDLSQVPQSETELAAMSLEELANSLADTNGDGVISEEPVATPENNSDTAWITEANYRDFLLLDCTDCREPHRWYRG